MTYESFDSLSKASKAGSLENPKSLNSSMKSWFGNHKLVGI